MTTADAGVSEVADGSASEGLGRRYGSGRGPFEVFTTQAPAAPPRVEDITDEMLEFFVGFFDYSGLVDDEHPEAEVRAAVKELSRASMPGISSHMLFEQPGENGMSVAWLWLAPEFELFRHSHPQLGDCLYLVIAGQMHLGSRVLGPGEGFFTPAAMPYRYRAGAEGVQVLEIRAGVDTPLGSPGTFMLHEPSLESIRKLTESLAQHHAEWAKGTALPSRVGEDMPVGH